jgi:NitT/TauT family transport system substrate-binding protein
VLLAVVGLAGCVGPAPPALETVRVGLYPTQDFLPYFVVREQGLDTAHGLRFETENFAGGAGVIAAMVDGRIDVGIVGTIPVLSAAERGLIPGTIVTVAANNVADADHRAVGVVAAPSVRHWRDLDGARIAINARDSIGAAAIAGRLRLEGVRDYTFIEIAFPNMGLAVAGGNVAAASMSEPFLTQSLARGDGRLLDWVIGGGAPFAEFPVTVIVVTADVLRRRGPVVAAYLRTHLLAVRWINANVEAARTLAARRLDLAGDIGRRFNLLRWPADARNDPALLDGMQPALVASGHLRAPIPARRLYDEALLDRALTVHARAQR